MLLGRRRSGRKTPLVHYEEKEEEVSLSNLLMRGLYYAQSGFLVRWNDAED
jgi:hypothetical protein